MKIKIKIRILNYLFRFLLRLKKPVNIIRQHYWNFKNVVKKARVKFKAQAKTFPGWIKRFPMRIYKKIDTGNPTWLSILQRLNIVFYIRQPIITAMKSRKRHRHLMGFIPRYCSLGSNSIMISIWSIPEDSDTILEMRKIFKLLQENNWVKITKVETIDNGIAFSDKPNISFDTKFKHKEHGQIDVWIYLDSKCDIEFKDVVKKEPVMAGMCAEVLEELNKN